MMEKKIPVGDGIRYASLVGQIVGRIINELEPDVTVDAGRLKEAGMKGLTQALRTHKTRHGTTLANYLWYGICDSVLDELGEQLSDSAERLTFFSCRRRANHFMSFYGGSAEGAIKRDIRDVLSEVDNLLRCVILICWFSLDAMSRNEVARGNPPILKPTSTESLQEILEQLSDSERSLLATCYSEPSFKSLAGTVASVSDRAHWKILQKLVRNLRDRHEKGAGSGVHL